MTQGRASGNGEYAILLYHGVHGDGLDLGLRNSSGKHVSRARFAAEMKRLKSLRPIVAMAEIGAAHSGEGRLPVGAVAVTFDDGFRNNMTHAWPVLEEYRIPATIYLATGYVDGGRHIWTDRLEAAILGTSRSRLDVDVEGLAFHYGLGDDAARLAAFNDVRLRCKKVTNAEKDRIVAAIEAELGGALAADDPLSTFMSWDEARAMDASPLITFGAHTVDHVSLARVPGDEMRRQVDASVGRVVDELGHDCAHFSYPEGQADDFNAAVISHLKKRGFDHCPTAIAGTNCLGETDPFHLRRFMVGMEGRPFPFD